MKLISFFFFLISCASFKSDQKYTVKGDISYGTHERHVGDFYQSNVMDAPLVVVVHGGGWRGRDKGDTKLIAESLASHGFNVFNINYRLAPEYKHPAPIGDLELAIKFCKEKFQFSKLALWGYSAGAHISLMYGLRHDDVAAIVSGGAPYDLSWYEHSPYIVPYLGYDREGRVRDYLNASPVTYLHKDAPPMFLYHSIADDLVEHAQMRVFYTKGELLGLKIETYDVKFWSHINTFVFAKGPVVKGIKFLKSKL